MATQNVYNIINGCAWIKNDSEVCNYGKSIGVLKQGESAPRKIIDLETQTFYALDNNPISLSAVNGVTVNGAIDCKSVVLNNKYRLEVVSDNDGNDVLRISDIAQPNSKYLDLKLADTDNQLLKQSDMDSIVQEVNNYATEHEQQVSTQIKALAECFLLLAEVQSDQGKVNKLREIING